MDSEGASLMCRGKLFHHLGATTEKAPPPLSFLLDLSTSEVAGCVGMKMLREVRWGETVKAFKNKHENFQMNSEGHRQPVRPAQGYVLSYQFLLALSCRRESSDWLTQTLGDLQSSRWEEIKAWIAVSKCCQERKDFTAASHLKWKKLDHCSDLAV